MHVQNKKCVNFVSISRLTGECAAQKIKKTFAVLVYGHVYITKGHKRPSGVMVLLYGMNFQVKYVLMSVLHVIKER